MWRAITPIWVSSYCHTVILFLIFLVSMTMGIMVQAPNLHETVWGESILFFFSASCRSCPRGAQSGRGSLPLTDDHVFMCWIRRRVPAEGADAEAMSILVHPPHPYSAILIQRNLRVRMLPAFLRCTASNRGFEFLSSPSHSPRSSPVEFPGGTRSRRV